MTRRTRAWFALGWLALTAACSPRVVVSTPTAAPTHAPVPTATRPAPTPTTAPKVLTVCMSQEPASLIWTDRSFVTTAVLEAINDGSIDTRSYGYQPVIFEKLPSLADGDAVRREVTVMPGQMVVDARSGLVVPMAHGVWLAQLDGEPKRYDRYTDPATTVQVSATWTLVRGLTWHDGQPVTADDQVFMFETSKSPRLPTLKYTAERTESFVAVDERTTRWTGLPGFDDGAHFLNVWSPLPRHAYGAMTPEAMLASPQVNWQPLGYGPFRVMRWEPGEFIELVAARDTYWRAAEGLPKLDRLTFRFVGDPARLGQMLVSGECDLGTQDVPLEGQLDYLSKYEAQGRLSIFTTPGPVLESLNFNAQPNPAYGGFAARLKNPDGSPIFSDAVTRRAFAHCIDRQALVDEALSGAAVVPDAYLPPNHPLFPQADAESLPQYPFDPAKGRALLKSRGWADHDGDGVLDRLGEKFSVAYVFRVNPVREQIAGLIQSQLLQNCQIEARLKPYGAEFLIAESQGVVFGRRFDVGQWAWPVGAEPPCALYLGDAVPSADNQWEAPNIAGFANAEFDRACRAAQAAEDPAQRAEWHAQALRIFAGELPALPLYARLKIAVASSRLQGLHLDPTSGSELWNVEQFDLAP